MQVQTGSLLYSTMHQLAESKALGKQLEEFGTICAEGHCIKIASVDGMDSNGMQRNAHFSILAFLKINLCPSNPLTLSSTDIDLHSIQEQAQVPISLFSPLQAALMGSVLSHCAKLAAIPWQCPASQPPLWDAPRTLLGEQDRG